MDAKGPLFVLTGGVEDCSGDRNANNARHGADGISHAEQERRVTGRQVSMVAVQAAQAQGGRP